MQHRASPLVTETISLIKLTIAIPAVTLFKRLSLSRWTAAGLKLGWYRSPQVINYNFHPGRSKHALLLLYNIPTIHTREKLDKQAFICHTPPHLA